MITKMFSKIFIVALALVSVQAAPLNTYKHNRVVGGNNAYPGEFPHQISLEYENTILGIPRRNVCGASVINNQWIMTAGHCITNMPSRGIFHAVAGIDNLKEIGQDMEIALIVVHPKFQGGINPNDIAMMKLTSPLTFNDKVKPVNLPDKDAIPTGTSTLSGWGSTSSTLTPEYPDDLQTADLPIVSYEDCAEALRFLNGTSSPLKETNICTGPLTGGFAACTHDSGSPLVTYYNNVPTQIGLVSWGMVPCSFVGVPSVYTRVSAFLDFINETIATY